MRLDRRSTLLLGAFSLAQALAALAQPSREIKRIGVLMGADEVID